MPPACLWTPLIREAPTLNFPSAFASCSGIYRVRTGPSPPRAAAGARMGREMRENRRSGRNGPNPADKGNLDVVCSDPVSSREKKSPVLWQAAGLEGHAPLLKPCTSLPKNQWFSGFL